MNESYKTGDTSVLDEIAIDDLVVHGIPKDNVREGLKQSILNRRTSTTDFSITIEDMIAEGEKVSIRATRRVTEQTKLGIKNLTVARFAIFYITNGNITDIWILDEMLS
ncbi:ester cyclase [Chloroflexota bacterium]